MEPYGTDNVPGFYNVLPPGENGLDNAVQFLATVTTRPDSTNQLPLCENLLDAAPTLTPSEIPQ